MIKRRHPDDLFAVRKTKAIPFEFVLDELAGVDPWTRPMFGCTAVYVEERIVFILRDKKDRDNGVWVATTKERHASLRRELPNLRSIAVFGVGETGWQMLPVDAEDFEQSVLLACALVRAVDPRNRQGAEADGRRGGERRGATREDAFPGAIVSEPASLLCPTGGPAVDGGRVNWPRSFRNQSPLRIRIRKMVVGSPG